MALLFQDATPLLDQPEKLREQADKDGFLFFRGLLQADKLLALRREMLEILNARDLLDRSCDLMDGIGDLEAIDALTLDRSDVGVTGEIYLEIQRLKRFQGMVHDPALLELFRLLFQTAPFPHPLTIGRIMLPHRKLRATPAHQDFIHIQGTTSTWTTWFPLGDTPRELGGLSVLQGSHKLGTLSVTSHAGAGGLETILCDLDLEWVEGDYRVGDVLTFHSQMVHKALPNRLGNKIRLSCDFRYQPSQLEIDKNSLLPHLENATWEDVYQGWPDDEWKYYWRKDELKLSAWDESIRWQKDKIC